MMITATTMIPNNTAHPFSSMVLLFRCDLVWWLSPDFLLGPLFEDSANLKDNVVMLEALAAFPEVVGDFPLALLTGALGGAFWVDLVSLPLFGGEVGKSILAIFFAGGAGGSDFGDGDWPSAFAVPRSGPSGTKGGASGS